MYCAYEVNYRDGALTYGRYTAVAFSKDQLSTSIATQNLREAEYRFVRECSSVAAGGVLLIASLFAGERGDAIRDRGEAMWCGSAIHSGQLDQEIILGALETKEHVQQSLKQFEELAKAVFSVEYPKHWIPCPPPGSGHEGSARPVTPPYNDPIQDWPGYL